MKHKTSYRFYFGASLCLLVNTLHAQTSPTEVVKVGLGSYSLRLPSGAKEPAESPFITPDAKRPIPTNKWWSSLVFTPYSNQMYPHPLGIQAQEAGLRVFAPGVGSIANVAGVFSRGAGERGDLIISTAAQERFPDARVASWSDWFVTAVLAGKKSRLNLTFGHGSPFVFGTVQNSHPRFSFPKAPTLFFGDAKSSALGVTLEGKHYGLFGSTGSQWKGIGTQNLECEGKPYFSVALLPDNSPKTFALFQRYAHNHITDSKVQWEYDEKKSNLTTTYTFTVKAYEGNEKGTLFCLFPHQYRRSQDTLTDYSYNSVRGTLRLGIGTGFKTATLFHGVLPALPDYGTFDKAALQRFVEEDATNFKPALADTYWTGKALGKLATLASIADMTGNSTAKAKLTSRVKALLEDYFTAKSDDAGKLTEAKGLFYYNKAWGTLIGYPASYGSDEALNDHHFHYGYFIRSAVELVRQDPKWGEANNWGGMVNLLIRDCANPNREDTLFPFLRNFDVYEGHTWADGKGDFGDGNNNESSSEAMNAWTGMILWGAFTGDKKIRDTGIYLYTTEKEAIENYWFDVHRHYPKEFTRPMVSMVWGGKAVYATWFSADPIHMHGINMLPLQSGSLYLGAYPNAVQQNIKGLISERLTHDKEHGVKSNAPRINDNWGGWGDVILMYQALSDPKTALNFSRFSTQEIEEGNSRANFYQWIHLLNAVGNVDTQVTADTPLYAVFVKDKRRTYVVYSLSNRSQTIHFSDGFTLKTSTVGMHLKAGD